VIANKLSEKAKMAKRKGISVTLKAGVSIGTKSAETAPVKQADEA
jgi:hypothetical protein